MKLRNDDNRIIITNFQEREVYAIYLNYNGSFDGNILQDSISIVRMNKNTIILVALSPIQEGDLMEYSGSLGIASGYYVSGDLRKYKIRFENTRRSMKNLKGTFSTIAEKWINMNQKETQDLGHVGVSKISYMYSGERVTINPKSRGGHKIYSSGEVYDINLPSSYKKRPGNSVCGNCVFNNDKLCSKWENAKIKNNYWCKSWRGNK